MKKALFVILLCFLYSGAGAQGFMLGDSITVHLTRLNLIENKGATLRKSYDGGYVLLLKKL